MLPRRMTRITQGTVRETSQPRGGSTPHLISGTPQEERVVDSIGTTLRVRQKSDRLS